MILSLGKGTVLASPEDLLWQDIDDFGILSLDLGHKLVSRGTGNAVQLFNVAVCLAAI